MLSFEDTWHALSATLITLPDKPRETARNTVAALWHLAQGEPLSAEAAEHRQCRPLTPDQETAFRALLARRLAGEPLAYITGRQRFLGLDLLTDRSALIPRPETELLAQAAIDLTRQLGDPQRPLLVLDVCTGTGNVALALARHTTATRIHAADLSPEAVRLVARNAALHGLEDRVHPTCGDLFAPFESSEFLERVDLVTCNPPYISSAKLQSLPDEIAAFEPSTAFDGGPFGVRLLQRLLAEAPRFLRPGGFLAVEIGLGQGRGIRRRIERNAAYDDVRELTAADGEVRALVARRSREPTRP